MINVGAKTKTLRYAKAEGVLLTTSEVADRVRRNDIPKGNVSATARAAGIFSAKRTSDIITFCQPIPLDWVDIQVEAQTEGKILVTGEVETVWKTGVEMEAVTAVSTALLNIFDMLKPLDPAMEMGGIRVVEKRGGKSQFEEEFSRDLKTAVLVISDSTYEGTREDKSGKVIREFLKDYPIDVSVYEILPDVEEQIRKRVNVLVEEEEMDLVVTTGGSGFGPKDLTPEAIRPLLEKEAPGIAEQLRRYGSERTPYAMLSRGIAGTIGETLVLCLPGSSNGARESLQALFPGVLHIFPMLWGGGH